MRKLIFIIAFLLSGAAFGQIHNLKAVGLDTLTTTEKNNLTVPADRVYLVYDETLGEIHINVKNGGWQNLETFLNVGSGTVDISGTPTTGQVAEWTDANTIQGVSTTGSGNYVRATSPTLVTPALGTPSSGTLTNATGYVFSNLTSIPSGLSDGDDVGILSLADDTTPQLSGDLDAQSNDILNVGSLEIETNLVADAAFGADIGSVSLAFSDTHSRRFTIQKTSSFKDWRIDGNVADDDLHIGVETTAGGGTFSALYKLNSTGTPSDPTDLVDVGYLSADNVSVSGSPTNYSAGDPDVQAHLEGIDAALGAIAPGTQPFSDATALLEDSADDTKLLGFQLSGITTGTQRTWTVPDENIDFNNRVETTSALSNSTPIYTIVAGNQTDVDGWASDPNRLDIVLDAAGNNLAEADQAIPASTTRVVDTDASGSSISFENAGTQVLKIGDNNDDAIYVKALEAVSGDVLITLVSPLAMANTDITSANASTHDHSIISDSNLFLPYFSNGTNWIPMAGNSRVVTSATISMTGNVMYDDQSTDAATITLSNCNAGDELTVYINRASAPTLAGTGLTFNQLPNTTAFAGATEMGIFFQVAYNGTTVDYYYFER